MYGKQSGVASLSVITPNNIIVEVNQSNPYLNEQSVYTISLNFTTPNASELLVTPTSSFIVSSAKCIVNCGSPSSISSGYLFSINSVYTTISLTVTNPTDFNSLNTFSFTTQGDSHIKDYAKYQPQLICTLPCRSCSSANSSICLTCYTWKT